MTNFLRSLLLLLFAIPCWAQYEVPRSGSGLGIIIGQGSTALSSGTVVSWPPATCATKPCNFIALTANTTTFGYIDPVSGLPTTSTIGVPSGGIPLFKAVTGVSSVTSITDTRSTYYAGGSSSGSTVYVSASGLVTPAGLKCDGVTDDTTAFNNALSALNTAGGGTIQLQGGTCLIAGLVLLPNDGANPPNQNAIRITGVSPSIRTNSTPNTPLGGTILNLTNNASTTAKIDTRGFGYLEIDHLSMIDTSTDCATFIATTNTTLHIHDTVIYGTTAQPSMCNDAIHLGNVSATVSGAFNSPFQGYGTVIENNFADNVVRFVYGQTWANSNWITNNSIWLHSGNATGGAIEFNGCGIACNGVSGGNDTGNIITGNLIEVPDYKYGIRLIGFSAFNSIYANNCYDQAGPYAACVRMETNATQNWVIDGLHANGTGLSDANSNAAGTSSSILSINDTTIFSGTSQQFLGNVTFNGIETYSAATPNTGWKISNTTTGDAANQNLSSGPVWAFNMIPSGGSTENGIQISRASATETDFILGKSADTTNLLNFTAGTLKIRAGNTGGIYMSPNNADTWVFQSGAAGKLLSVGTGDIGQNAGNSPANVFAVNFANATTGVKISAGAAPTIAGAGCGGSAAAMTANNGTAAFEVNTGTAPTSGGCTITMPAATTGWNCSCSDLTTTSTAVFYCKQTGAVSTTSVVLQNFSDVAVATAFVASDHLRVQCAGY